MHKNGLSATLFRYIDMNTATIKNEQVELKGDLKELFEVGAHYAYTRSRRHPSAKPYIFGIKNKVEIFDLERTKEALEDTLAYVKALGKKEATVLFVGGKNEARQSVEKAAESLDMPYVAGRWIGGTLTNFEQIKKRIERLITLREQKEKGELGKYTKRERLFIDREIIKLEERFGGVVSLKALPAAVFVVDSRYEDIAVHEANTLHIPVISLSGSDCDLSKVTKVIPANDSAIKSIKFFVNKVAEAYKEGRAQAAK